MEKDLIYIRNLIENKVYKFTTQKKYILSTLIESKNHLTAEEIYNIVKKHSIGIATVYRSLKVFKELNIVKEISIDGINYYEMKIFSKKPLHIHFKCIKCNSIIDIDNLSLYLDYLRLNKSIEEDNNLIIYDTNILQVGLCNKCMEDKDGKTN